VVGVVVYDANEERPHQTRPHPPNLTPNPNPKQPSNQATKQAAHQHSQSQQLGVLLLAPLHGAHPDARGRAATGTRTAKRLQSWLVGLVQGRLVGAGKGTGVLH